MGAIITYLPCSSAGASSVFSDCGILQVSSMGVASRDQEISIITLCCPSSLFGITS